MKKLALTLALTAAPLTSLYASDNHHASNSSTVAKVGAVTGVASATYLAAPHVKRGLENVSKAAQQYWEGRTEEQRTALVFVGSAIAGVVLYHGAEPVYHAACFAVEAGADQAKKAWGKTQEVARTVKAEVVDTYRNEKKWNRRVVRPTIVAIIAGTLGVAAKAAFEKNN